MAALERAFHRAVLVERAGNLDRRWLGRAFDRARQREREIDELTFQLNLEAVAALRRQEDRGVRVQARSRQLERRLPRERIRRRVSQLVTPRRA